MLQQATIPSVNLDNVTFLLAHMNHNDFIESVLKMAENRMQYERISALYDAQTPCDFLSIEDFVFVIDIHQLNTGVMTGLLFRHNISNFKRFSHIDIL